MLGGFSYGSAAYGSIVSTARRVIRLVSGKRATPLLTRSDRTILGSVRSPISPLASRVGARTVLQSRPMDAVALESSRSSTTPI